MPATDLLLGLEDVLAGESHLSLAKASPPGLAKTVGRAIAGGPSALIKQALLSRLYFRFALNAPLILANII